MESTSQLTRQSRALFVPHGAPTFALRPGAAGAALRDAAEALPRPRAIVVLSPHWESAQPLVGSAARLETIHDFGGFPQELYQIRYPASGCPGAAAQVVQALQEAGLPAQADHQRGLDHGAWVPLRMMFPDADVPVIPVSVQPQAGPAGALRLGQALAPLMEQGMLVLGTGNLTHNLRDYMLARAGQGVPDYVRAFPAWVAERLARHDLEALLDYRRQAPDAVRAHPTEEHLLPLFVALGAGGAEQARATHLHAGIDDYVLAMDAWAFEKEIA